MSEIDFSELCVNPFDIEMIKAQAQTAVPFPHFCIDNFLDENFAREVANAYPTFEEAERLGLHFKTVNEQRKVQVTESSTFPDPVSRLHQTLRNQDLLDVMSEIMAIPNLVADPDLWGGGIHMTGPGGRLDVHLDFNVYEQRNLHRRMNLIVYLTPEWHATWGGNLELWDRDVRHCHHSFVPKFNRCLAFATGPNSFHGVTPLRCPVGRVRQSFAVYFYTEQPDPDWGGKVQGSVFKARPDEKLRGHVLMPLEQFRRRMHMRWYRTKQAVKSVLKPAR